MTHFPRFQKDVFPENIKLVHQIEEVAAKKGCTAAQAAIAWVKAQGTKSGRPLFIPLPGASTAERVAENCKEVTLSNEEVEEIDVILAKAEIKGDRYPPMFMAQLES